MRPQRSEARPSCGREGRSPLVLGFYWIVAGAFSVSLELLRGDTPAIAIGAGGTGGGAHTLQEWFRPEGRDLGLKRIFLLMLLLLGPRLPEPGSDGR